MRIFHLFQTKYLIQTQLCTTSRICNFGDHVIFVVFEKASITADKEKFLEMILFQNEDMLERARSSDVHKIGDLFAFKVNSNTIFVDSLAYVLVKINDEDVPDPKIELFPIRVQYKIYLKAELPKGLRICHRIAIGGCRRLQT